MHRGSTRPGARTRVELALLLGIVALGAALRLPLLHEVPNGLFLDEASRGYDAYALIQTGADQFGTRLPVFAEGLDDYTPALYTYLAAPSIAALGLTEWAIRLPAAVAGIATIGFTYLLARSMYGGAIGLASAALLAIAPWHILPSRTGAEWVLLPLFTTLGFWLLLAGTRKPPLIPISALVLGLGLYSYAFARLLIPLLLLGFAFIWRRELTRHWRESSIALLTLGVFMLPIVWFATTPAGQARLLAVIPVNRLGASGLGPYLVTNYLSYFDPSFLVIGTEPSNHHRLAGFGPILPFMAPLAVAGIAISAFRRGQRDLFWLWWLVAAPAASALHRESPSSALLLGAIPSWHLLAAVGGAGLISWVGRSGRSLQLLALAAILLVGAVNAVLVARGLYVEYPRYSARDWLYGAREVVAYLEGRRSEYDGVIVSDRLETPHVLVLFYARVDPAMYQKSPIHVRQPNVRSRGDVGPYHFAPVDDTAGRVGRYLVWARPEERVAGQVGSAPLLTIAYPDGTPAHVVHEVAR